MDCLPDILLELSKAADAARTLEFFNGRESLSEQIGIERENLADALYQAKEYLVAMAEEYEVEIA